MLMKRLLIALLVVVTFPVTATASSLTLFDLNLPPFPTPVTGAPATYDYGCNGKGYCTDWELYLLAAHSGFETISTTRDGITLTLFNTGPGGYHLQGGNLDPGNFIGAYDDAGPFYVAGFSTPLEYAQVDLLGFANSSPPASGIYEYFLEGYDGPQGTGNLLGRTSIDMFGGPTTLELYAPGMQSIVFGSVGIPGGGCFWCDNSAGADNIAVRPVPEPAATLLFLFGGGVVAAWVRRQIGRP
jgi:hypothetical protein